MTRQKPSAFICCMVFFITFADMAGSIGNQNAVGNEGGRPPYFDVGNPDDIQKLTDLCEGYIEYIKGEFTKTETEEGDMLIKTVREPEVPTVTGLTLFLGFESKSTLYDYAKKIEFSHPIKKALTKIEQYHEIMAAGGDKCTGNIFILKNFGWRDTIDHTTGGDKINTTPTIVFKKFNKDEQ